MNDNVSLKLLIRSLRLIFVIATRKVDIMLARMDIWRPLIRARFARRISSLFVCTYCISNILNILSLWEGKSCGIIRRWNKSNKLNIKTLKKFSYFLKPFWNWHSPLYRKQGKEVKKWRKKSEELFGRTLLCWNSVACLQWSRKKVLT